MLSEKVAAVLLQNTGRRRFFHRLFRPRAPFYPDLYRFIREAAADIGAPLVTVTEGRTPWDVFRDVRFLGNSRVDPCSRVLKREPLRKWLVENTDPSECTIYLGIGWDETAAMGDDWPDLPLLTRAAFACAPPNAHAEVLAVAHHVTAAPGGHGAARECCDLLLAACGRYGALLDGHLSTLDGR